MSLTEHGRVVKRNLIDATNAIRKKIRAFRSGVNADEESFQKTFKLIIEPLTEVVSVIKQKVLKTEPKTVEADVKQTTPKARLKQRIDMQREVLHSAKQKLEPLAEVKQEERFFDTEDEVEEIHLKALEYLKDLSETPQHFDTQYGPHLDDEGQLKMGNANIRFIKKSLHLMRGGDIIAQYNITPELLNVLF